MVLFMSEYIPQLLIVGGFILILFEVLALGFSTFILAFLGLSMVLSGTFIALGWMGDSWNTIALSNAVLTALLAALLWKPLKKMQNKQSPKRVTSDFHGLRFYSEQEIDKRGLSQYRHSGVSWALKSEQPIEAGTEVEVVDVEVAVFWVKPVS